MMKRRFTVILLLCAAFMPEPLQARFVNSDIYKTGSFPNGVDYYLVNNSSVKGVVDIALVQRDPGDVRSLLDSLEGFGKRSPGRYLIDHGVAFSRRGYAFEEDGAAVYRFSDVPVGASLDSTLFLLANLVRTSPSSQTLIMCGDINTDSVRDRMGLLMMGQEARKPLPAVSGYVWKPRTERTVQYIDNGRENSAVVNIKYFIPRLPAEARMTTQPVLSRFFSTCLTAMLRERMTVAFKNRNIALSDMKAVYLGSSDGGGDETYTISFRVLTGELCEAMNCAASVMSGIRKEGVTPEEFIRVNSRIIDFLADKVKSNTVSNAAYVRTCLNACLYGASLAATQDIYDYVSKRQFGLEQVTHFFNMFTSAMLDKTDRADFTILASQGPDADRLMDSFDLGWKCPVFPEQSAVPQFESVINKSGAGVMVRRETNDNISGGTMWRFSNGMKVIFKRTDGDIMNYYLVVRGGVQSIENPGIGETAFVQDMFNLCGIDGMKHSDFDLILASKGITVKCFADYNGLTLYGKVPADKLTLLPAVLSKFKDLSLPDKADMDYYRKCVRTQEEKPAVLMNYRIDRLLRPGDGQLEYKFSRNITDSTAIKALNYYRKQFTKMNDGVLMIFGDMNPNRVLSKLHSHLGVLSTTRKPLNVNCPVSPQLSTGVSMVMDSLAALDVNSARIRVKFNKPITRESNTVFTLATMCVEEAMQKLLYDRGFSVKSSAAYSLYPEDTFTATFDIIPCVPYGLPSHIGNPSSVFDAIADLHTGLKSGGDVPTANLDLYKTILSSRLSNELSDESKLIAYTLLRYASGRNLTSDYKSQIKSVSASAVSEMADKILSAGRVEYIVR